MESIKENKQNNNSIKLNTINNFIFIFFHKEIFDYINKISISLKSSDFECEDFCDFIDKLLSFQINFLTNLYINNKIILKGELNKKNK